MVNRKEVEVKQTGKYVTPIHTLIPIGAMESGKRTELGMEKTVGGACDDT